MTPQTPRPITALMVGEQSAHKPLRPFGFALKSSPVREGRAEAEANQDTPR